MMDTVGVELSGMRVLVVEDDALIAMELQDLLETRGADVVGPVPTVAAALAALAAERPDAAVLDANLRGVRSTRVAEALLAARVPFVLATGYSRSQLDEPTLREVPLLPKPIHGQELVRLLQRHRPPGREEGRGSVP